MTHRRKSGRSTRKQSVTPTQVHKPTDGIQSRLRNGDKLELNFDTPQTSPDLFNEGKTTTRMASALPIPILKAIAFDQRLSVLPNHQQIQICEVTPDLFERLWQLPEAAEIQEEPPTLAQLQA